MKHVEFMARYSYYTSIIAMIIFVGASAMADDRQYTYSYQPTAVDIPLDIANCDATTLSAWMDTFRHRLRNATPNVSECTVTDMRPNDGDLEIACEFPSGPTLTVDLLMPSQITAGLPVIYYFPAWGYFARDTTPGKLRRDGYVVVIIPYQQWLTALEPLYANGRYLPVWGRVAANISEAIESKLPAHNGFSIVSSATGSLVVPFFALWNPGAKAIVTNGVMISLDWLRRNYRWFGLPNIWDLGYVNSFTPIFSTLAGSPVQHQMGSADAFWPSSAPIDMNQRYPGSARGQTLDETLGTFLVIEHISGKTGIAPVLHLGAQGHLEPDYGAVIKFLTKELEDRRKHGSDY